MAMTALSRLGAGLARCPGLAFDNFGRRLAVGEILAGRRDQANWHLLLNPVSCVRYMEFDYAARMLADLGKGARVLDISSPRLFGLWLAQKRDVRLSMANPDERDFMRTRVLAERVKVAQPIDLHGFADATELVFEADSFDAAFSISVIEHVGDEKRADDTKMMSELARVVRPGGRVVLTFPVGGTHVDEFRDHDPYGLKAADQAGRYFFQRFYSNDSIAKRLLSVPGIREISRSYFIEKEAGWFHAYEREWMRRGLHATARDPWLMARNFQHSETHPVDRIGVCGLTVEVEG